MNLVTVFRAFNDAEAHLVRSRLEAAGIEVTVQNEELGSMLAVATGGIQLRVREDQAEEARTIVNEAPPTPPPMP